jgi:hypothetical protein
MAKFEVHLRDIGKLETFSVEVEAENYAEAGYIAGDNFSSVETKLVDCVRLS